MQFSCFRVSQGSANALVKLRK